MNLILLPPVFAVSRAAPHTPLPPAIAGSTATILSITRTSDELSVVAEQQIELRGFVQERDWRCLKVRGPLSFEQIGILASLTSCLAAAAISVFAISTFDTDYLLVRSNDLERAVEALRASGHRVDDSA